MIRSAAPAAGGSPGIADPSTGWVASRRPGQVPSSPLRRLWQLARWILDPTGFLRDQSRQGKDSFQVSVFGSAMGSAPVFLLSDPRTLQWLMSRDTGSEFSSPGELNLLLSPMLGVRNMIMLSGGSHRHHDQNGQQA